jgi:olfactory receptor
LAIFWFHVRELSLDHCITYIFIQLTFISESEILLVLVFEHYIAICYPLGYTTILTYTSIGKTSTTIFLKSYGTIVPTIFLLKRLTFCKNSITLHTYCDYICLAKYACKDIQINVWYRISVLILTVVLDSVLIFVCVLIHCAIVYTPSQHTYHEVLNNVWLQKCCQCYLIILHKNLRNSIKNHSKKTTLEL